MSVSLTDGESVLIERALEFLREHFTNPPMKWGEPYRNDFPWTPPLQIKATNHRTVFVQPSEEKVYPAIMSMSHGDLHSLTDPIVVYSLCPTEVANRPDQQREIERLRSHGYGLIIVDADGICDLRVEAIPLIQFIPPEPFNHAIAGISLPIRRLLKDAYGSYRQNPVMGVKAVCDITEGLVLKAGKDAVKKTWIPSSKAKPGQSAATLDALGALADLRSAQASLGGMRAFIQTYRNTNAHYPKGKAQAIAKYQDCRHSFFEGITRIKNFTEQMKSTGLSGRIEIH